MKLKCLVILLFVAQVFCEEVHEVPEEEVEVNDTKSVVEEVKDEKTLSKRGIYSFGNHHHHHGLSLAPTHSRVHFHLPASVQRIKYIQRVPVHIKYPVVHKPVVHAHVPVHVQAPVHAHVPVHAHAPVHVHAPVHTHIPVQAQAPVHAHIPVQAQAPVHAHIPIQAPVHAHIPVQAQAPVHAHIPIHAPIHAHYPIHAQAPVHAHVPVLQAPQPAYTLSHGGASVQSYSTTFPRYPFYQKPFFQHLPRPVAPLQPNFVPIAPTPSLVPFSPAPPLYNPGPSFVPFQPAQPFVPFNPTPAVFPFNPTTAVAPFQPSPAVFPFNPTPAVYPFNPTYFQKPIVPILPGNRQPNFPVIQNRPVFTQGGQFPSQFFPNPTFVPIAVPTNTPSAVNPSIDQGTPQDTNTISTTQSFPSNTPTFVIRPTQSTRPMMQMGGWRPMTLHPTQPTFSNTNSNTNSNSNRHMFYGPPEAQSFSQSSNQDNSNDFLSGNNNGQISNELAQQIHLYQQHQQELQHQQHEQDLQEQQQQQQFQHQQNLQEQQQQQQQQFQHQHFLQQQEQDQQHQHQQINQEEEQNSYPYPAAAETYNGSYDEPSNNGRYQGLSSYQVPLN